MNETTVTTLVNLAQALVLILTSVGGVKGILNLLKDKYPTISGNVAWWVSIALSALMGICTVLVDGLFDLQVVSVEQIGPIIAAIWLASQATYAASK